MYLGDFIIANEHYKDRKYDNALKEAFFKIDEELEKDWGRDEIAAMKRKNPPNKTPLMKILGGDNGKEGGAELTNEQLMLDSIGCTANVVLIEDYKKLYVANAGDSRCVLCRSGKAIPLSVDHKPENDVEKRRIEKAGSTISDGRVDGNLNLSRSLGDLKYKNNKSLKPDEHPITALPDTLVQNLSTDD